MFVLCEACGSYHQLVFVPSMPGFEYVCFTWKFSVPIDTPIVQTTNWNRVMLVRPDSVLSN